MLDRSFGYEGRHAGSVAPSRDADSWTLLSSASDCRVVAPLIFEFEKINRARRRLSIRLSFAIRDCLPFVSVVRSDLLLKLIVEMESKRLDER